jgi:hypothetical protein
MKGMKAMKLCNVAPLAAVMMWRHCLPGVPGAWRGFCP